MELVVREVGSAVAVEAIGPILLAAGFVFGEEEFHAPFFDGGELGFAGHRAVEFGIVAGEGEEKIFECESDFFCGDFAGAEGLFEGGVFGFFKMGDDGGEIGGHFPVVLNGLKDLVAEGPGTTVPEEGRLPGEIEEGHGVAAAFPLCDAFGKDQAVGEGFVLMMTGRAGDAVVFGKARIVKEFFSKAHAFFEEGIIAGEERHWETPAHFEREGGEFPGKVKRGDGGEGSFIGRVRSSLNREGTLEVGDEGAGDGIAGVRVGGVAVFPEGE